MFCEKCGSFVPDSARFCKNCGASLTPESEQKPENQKKPLSKKTKKLLIIGVICSVAVIAIVVLLFTVIIPAIDDAGRVNLSEYYTVTLEDGINSSGKKSVADGNISGTFKWDYAKLAKDKGISEEKAKELLDKLSGYMRVTVTKDGSTLEGNKFENAGKDTVFKVTVRWLEEADLEKYGFEYVGKDGGSFKENVRKAVEDCEGEYGVKFKSSTMTTDLNLGKALKNQGIEVLDSVGLDVLGYVKKNDLVAQTGAQRSDIKVFVKAFEAEIGGYTVKKDSDGAVAEAFILNADGEKLGSFQFSCSENYYYPGETIKIGYDSYSAESLAKKGLNLTGDEIEYTVQEPDTGIDKSNYKNYAGELKEWFDANVHSADETAKDTDTIQLKNIYYNPNLIAVKYVIFVYYNSTQKYYRVIYLDDDDVIMEDGKIVYDGYINVDDSGKTIDEALDKCSAYEVVGGENPEKIM